MAVSSFETRSTQSNSSPMGRPSRILPARSRIWGAISFRAWGATAGDTALRWMSCFGGSMAMNIGSGSMFCWPPAMVMPPFMKSDENRLWSVSIAMMSLYLVIDQ